MQATEKKPWFKHILWISLVLGGVIAVLLWLKKHVIKKQPSEQERKGLFEHSIQGLSYAEVEQRKTGQRAQARMLAEKRVRQEQMKRRIFSIFNITLMVMFITQLVMQEYWGAFGTLGALILNVAVSAFHQIRSSRQVGKLLAAVRPQATVIREGEFSNVDQDNIVTGDVLVVGKGDEIFANGIILESSQFQIDSTPNELSATIESKNDGDPLTAGSFCESGWAIYQVDTLIEDVKESQTSGAATPISEIKTPLQKGIQTMLLVLLAIAGIFYVILIVELLRLDYFPSDLILIYRHAISIIFSIAPSGLLFMVIINYAIGSANIAKSGALIRNSNTIEQLAQVSNVLLVRKKNLDSLSLQVDLIAEAEGEFLFSETRARQLLGNYVHSIPSMQFPLTIIKDELDGSRYPIKREARFFSVVGWEAITFDSEDMQGTYVIGYPQFFQDYLEIPPQPQEDQLQPENQTEKQSGLGGRFIKKWFTRKHEDVSPEPVQDEETSDDIEIIDEPDQPNQSRWQKLKNRFRFGENAVEDIPIEPVPEDEEENVIRLLFAYAPGLLPAVGSMPRLPEGLKPICYIEFIKAYRSDVKAALQAIQDMGIKRKILSSGQLFDIDGLAKELNIDDLADLSAQIINGDQFDANITAGEVSAIHNKSVFYQHTTEQMSQVIDLLRDDGQFVAIKISNNDEIPLTSHADISITSYGSSNKVITKADVVLMNNSPETLPTILQMGQNIVNSLVNLLKLNLTEIGYVLLLIFGMFILGSRRFVYEPVQGAIIGIVTITLPSFFISLWTNSLKADREKIGRQLIMFTIPAVFTITLVVIGTFFAFLESGYPLFRVQHIISHLLVLIGLLLVVFCYPPLPLLSANGRYVSDWRLVKVSVILFALLNALTFLPIFQRHLRIFPLLFFRDYLVVWAIGLGWGLLTLLVWRIGWNWLGRKP